MARRRCRVHVGRFGGSPWCSSHQGLRRTGAGQPPSGGLRKPLRSGPWSRSHERDCDSCRPLPQPEPPRTRLGQVRPSSAPGPTTRSTQASAAVMNLAMSTTAEPVCALALRGSRGSNCAGTREELAGIHALHRPSAASRCAGERISSGTDCLRRRSGPYVTRGVSREIAAQTAAPADFSSR